MARAPMMATPPVSPIRCISAPDTVTVFMTDYQHGLEGALKARPRPVGNGYWVNYPQRIRNPLVVEWNYRLCLDTAISDDLKTVQLYASNILVVRADIALDMIVPTLWDAELLEKYVLDHLVKHRRRAEERWVQAFAYATSYSDWRAKRDRRYAIYCDKPSKRTGEHCVHIELRLYGSKFADRAGLGSLNRILNLDHDDFWRHQLAFRSVTPKQVWRQAEKFWPALDNGFPKKHARIMDAWRDLARQTGYEDPMTYTVRRRLTLHARGQFSPDRYLSRKLEELPAADLLDWFPKLKRVARSIDHTWALPPRSGGCTW